MIQESVVALGSVNPCFYFMSRFSAAVGRGGGGMVFTQTSIACEKGERPPGLPCAGWIQQSTAHENTHRQDSCRDGQPAVLEKT